MNNTTSGIAAARRYKVQVNGRPLSPFRIILAGIAALLLSTSCSTDRQEQLCHGYACAEDAIAVYEALAGRIAATPTASADELAALANEWRCTGDSVSAAVLRDSIAEHAISYLSITDSIRSNYARLVDATPRTLADYLTVARDAHGVRIAESTKALVDSTHRMLADFDRQFTYALGPVETIQAYISMLNAAKTHGFASRDAIHDFLRDEDKAFRSFLQHLPSLGDIPLAAIRDTTSAIMGDIVALASDDSPLIQPDEVVVLLTMRNNRRLIQNALQCVNDLRSGKVKGDEKTSAYLWMLYQPWFNFDNLSFALLSEAQTRTLGIIAVETEKALPALGTPPFPITPAELPGLLIKTLVLGPMDNG